MSQLQSTDPEIAALVAAEERLQADTLRLIPSENYVSAAVLEATGTVLQNKYSEGYPGKRYYEGQQNIDQVETLAIERAKALFEMEHANVQPYSGSPANLAVYLAFLKPGDTVLGMALPMGGHLTHGWGVSATGGLVQGRAVRRPPRHRAHRPGRGQGAGAEGAPQGDLLRRHGRARGPSTSRPSPRSPARSARCWSPTSRTSPGWSRAGRTPRRSGTRTWSPRPRTRPCAARAARCCCPPRSTRGRSTAPSSPGSRAARTTTPPPPSRSPCREASGEAFRGYAGRWWTTPARWASSWPRGASTWCRAAPTTTCC